MTAEHLKTLKHELRTPINHIIGYSELLAESATEDGHPDIASMASTIRNTGQSLANRIDKHLLGPPNEIGPAQMSELRDDMIPLLDTALAGRLQSMQQQAFSSYSNDLGKIYTALQQLKEAVQAESSISSEGGDGLVSVLRS